MSRESYRWRRWTYSFRAWIDDRGSNADKEHEWCQAFEGFDNPCPHRRMWDLNMVGSGKNIIRIIWWPRNPGKKPKGYLGPRYRRVF